MQTKKTVECINKSCKRRQIVYFESKLHLPEPQDEAGYYFTRSKLVDYLNRIMVKSSKIAVEKIHELDGFTLENLITLHMREVIKLINENNINTDDLLILLLEKNFAEVLTEFIEEQKLSKPKTKLQTGFEDIKKLLATVDEELII